MQLQWVVSVQVRERERGGTPVVGDDSQLLTERLIDRLKKKKLNPSANLPKHVNRSERKATVVCRVSPPCYKQMYAYVTLTDYRITSR